MTVRSPCRSVGIFNSGEISCDYRGMVMVESLDVSEELASEKPGIARVWIWEYVLKHSSSPRDVKRLLESFPFPDGVPRLKLMSLVKSLSNDLQRWKDLDVDKTIGILSSLNHQLVKCDLGGAEAEVEAVMSSKRLKTSSGEVSKRNVNGLGVQDKESVRLGLRQTTMDLSEELWRVEKCLPGEERTAMLKEVTGKLSAMVKRTWAYIGPATLEKFEAAVSSGEFKPEGVLFPVASGRNAAVTAGENEADPGNEGVSESAKRVSKERLLEPEKHIHTKSEENERARQELADSCAELEKTVNDPLARLLRNRVDAAEVPKTPPGHSTPVVSPPVLSPPVLSPPVLSPPGLFPPREKEQTAEPAAKRSLLEHHPSAQEQGWDDDEIEESPSRRSPSASLRLHLPPIQSPQRSGSEPGSKPRRPKKMWSEEETAVLTRGVNKYGKGSWKVILGHYKEKLVGRTEVDLKDKWRNMTKD